MIFFGQTEFLFFMQHIVLYYLMMCYLISACIFKLSYKISLLKKSVRDWNTSDELYFITSSIMIEWNNIRPGIVCLSNCIRLPNLLKDHLLFPTLDNQGFYWWSSYRTGSKLYWNSMMNLKIQCCLASTNLTLYQQDPCLTKQCSIDNPLPRKKIWEGPREGQPSAQV